MKKYSSGSFIDAALRVYGSEADTISSFPATVYADGENAAALIKGNLQQSGTPTAAAPITPTECGGKTANLFESVIVNANISESGSIYEGQSLYSLYVAEVEEGETYTFSGNNGPHGFYSDYPAIGSTSIDGTRHFGGQATIPIGCKYLAVRTLIDQSQAMCNKGSTALPYEPSGYVIPFESGDTTTNIYLGTTSTTRKIKKRIFTSDDTFSKGGSGSSAYFVINLGDSTGADCVCTHYINTPITASNTDIGASLTSASQNLCIRPEGVSDMTVDQFHAWVAAQVTAGTPLTIWYVLAAESVGILNEPLRKIGDNVDSVSATVPTLATAESITVDTTLKPSAVQLTYTGWHTHDDKKRSGGAWT